MSAKSDLNTKSSSLKHDEMEGNDKSKKYFIYLTNTNRNIFHLFMCCKVFKNNCNYFFTV